MSGGVAGAATLTIVNADDPGVGFNDPTPAIPVGGNTGITVGEQRMQAVQFAADIWGGILPSNVEILVRVRWEPLSCDATSGFLGFAGPWSFLSDFPGAPFANTWYPVALANKFAVDDLDAANPDIQTRFNVAVGTTGCLEGASWYYGLDNQASSLEFDLVTTALHEFAHGLGALDYLNQTTGELFGGQIDIYGRHIFDNTQGKHWREMTNGERAASVINTGNVVWDGESVTAEAPNHLGPRPRFTVEAPAGIAGTYALATAAFGGALTVSGVTSDLVLADDGTGVGSDACEPIVNDVIGRIALIHRGSCAFTLKVKAAQDAGAVAVVVVNNVAGGPITMGGSDASIIIPAVMVSQADGAILEAELSSGSVQVTLDLDANHLAGADDTDRVLLYAPNPNVPGSSIGHWDLSAMPDLLMEPNIPDGIPQTGDLTVELFRDLGWFEGEVAVAVTDMSVLAGNDGDVRLAWRLAPAGLEDLRGVGVQRAPAAAGPFTTLTAPLLSPAASMSFVDTGVPGSSSIWYRLMLVGHDGATELSRSVHLGMAAATTRTALRVPVETTAGEVELGLQIGAASLPVRLEIHDVTGRRLRTLDLGERRRGEHRTLWDRHDGHGRRVARGIYFVRMVAGSHIEARKMLLVR